jgi:glycosyltransferase involved in cell wall biosynthesis
VVKESRARWLLLSYWANVDGMACSHHIDDRLKHLARLGVEAEVITGTCGPRPGGWGRRWHRVPSVTATGYQFEVRQLTRPLMKPWRRIARLLLTLPVLPLYSMEKHVARLHSTFWWCISAAAVGLWSTRNGRHELIYSTGGEMSAHVAAALVARVRRLPWIAEMQDPIVYQGFGRSSFSRYVARRVERLVHSEATAVVYVTETAARRAALRTKGKAPCLVIRPGAEVSVRPRDPQRNEHMEVVHIGTLAGKRNPGALLEALERLAARRPSIVQEIRLSLVGNVDRHCRTLVKRYRHAEVVRLTGKVSRREAMRLASSAELLVIVQHEGPVSEETIPSKTYEYLMSGKVILGLTFRNGELAELLRERGHYTAEADDVAGIEAALEETHERWREGRLQVEPCRDYTVEKATEQMVGWARAVCNGRRLSADAESAVAAEGRLATGTGGQGGGGGR